jgi:hypothetical protein
MCTASLQPCQAEFWRVLSLATSRCTSWHQLLAIPLFPKPVGYALTFRNDGKPFEKSELEPPGAHREVNALEAN